MEKKKEFIINFIYLACILAIVYICFKYLISVILPFIIGFIFSYLAIKLSNKLFKESNKKQRVAALLSIYLAIILFITILVSSGVAQLSDFITTLPSFYKNTIEPYIMSIENNLISFGDSLPFELPVLSELTDDLFSGLRSILSSLTGALVNGTTLIIKNAPEAVVSLIVSIVSSFYMVLDYENITGWFKENLSEKVLETCYEIKYFIENTLFKIFTAYLTIMGITFIELVIGLTIIGISNSVMWAFIIALLDILPVLGVGTVLIPWGIGSLITGNGLLGVEILVIYVIITVIRNIIEPRFVGVSLGLHPLATLMSMIVGLRLFGGVGMFGLPITLAFLINKREK